MAVGFALGLLAIERMGLSYRIFLIAGGLAWVLSEPLLAPRLTGAGARTVTLAVLSGMAFPALGFVAAYLAQVLRP
jgi:hypothetical protein